jgi:acetyl-CoA C-acetyltransferase
MRDAFIIAGLRTPVCPRNGALSEFGVVDLGAAVLRALLARVACSVGDVDQVIIGNALYGGGNPARNILLAAGLPESQPALTIDTQCCAGLDAILLAANLVRCGEADLVAAGGAESFSRAPLRFHRPLDPGEAPKEYRRPPFAPWPGRDPDLLAAAAAFAEHRRLSRQAQEAFACESHRKALAAEHVPELVPIGTAVGDAFARPLSTGVCRRSPVLAGAGDHAITTALVAVEADAAGFVLVASERAATMLAPARACRIVAGARLGCPPETPMLGAQAAANALPCNASSVAVAEIMEAFACQAMGAVKDLSLPDSVVNRGGGALARGHPIGASGAILAVRLLHEMAREVEGARGIAAIAAAGGLGSALLLERV